jgi:hypothetical protein
MRPAGADEDHRHEEGGSGAAPVIIDRSANLDAVIDPLAKGGYYQLGRSAYRSSEYSFMRF